MRYLFKSLCLLFLPLLWTLPQIALAGPFSQRPAVKQFIHQLVVQDHFKKSELNALFNQVHLQTRVIKNIKQPYEKKPWAIYQHYFVTKSRIQHGLIFWKKHATLLKRTAQKYGVPARVIVAIIGVESWYGKHQGRYRVIDTLSTLAFKYPPRAKFFKNELHAFLLLSRHLNLDPLKVKGSYAGAIGYPQFMPSSYQHYAVNATGQAKVDLTRNVADAVASVANYFKHNGWRTGQPAALKLNASQAAHTPHDQLLRLTSDKNKEYWKIEHNFNVIMRYNHSVNYAMAVFKLSQALKAGYQPEKTA
jgi:peptidoglycan lytic transglycosylase B